MTEPDAVDLVNVADPDGDHCVVRVTGRCTPGVLTRHDDLCADISAHADFVDVRLELLLTRRDLDDWQLELTRLAPGTAASIGGERQPSLVVHMQDDGSLAVAIEDPDRVSALLGIRPREDWLAEHHDRLAQVRRTWPSEVMETVPGAYAWCPARGR